MPGLSDVVMSYPKLAPACRRRHRSKQAPGWHVRQTEPGVMRWTTPAGRTHTTNPTVYDV